VTRERLYLDTMQQIFANTSKVYIDSRANGNLMYLPLDKLVQQATAADASRVAPTTPPPAAAPEQPRGETPSMPPAMSRDGLRGRERDAGR
jgi:membrane protease subunit HflK